MAMSRAVFGGGGSSVTPGHAEPGAATGNGRGVGAYRSSDLWGGPSPADEADPGVDLTTQNVHYRFLISIT